LTKEQHHWEKKKASLLLIWQGNQKTSTPFRLHSPSPPPHRAPLEREKRNISGKREKKRKTTEKKTSEKRSFSPTLLAPFWKKKETGQRRKTGIYALKPHLGRDPAEIFHQKKKSKGERAGK